jgi:O-antigen/teichoic acid export membrane protein
MPAPDAPLGAGPRRSFRAGAAAAALALGASFAALGLNSILVSRIEGADGAGVIALSTQAVFLATFVAGAGLRTAIVYRVGAGLWSTGSAIRGALRAALALGVAGAALGMALYALLRDSALSEFDPAMAAALMAVLPAMLVWWLVPAVALAGERFEHYALMTVAGPLAVVVLCPLGALLGGTEGAVFGFAAGWALGGLAAAAWALRERRLPAAAQGPEHGLREAGAFGSRTWVNDLFALVNVRPDFFILSAWFGIAETGVYGVTVSITSLVWIVTQPLAAIVLPRTAPLGASGDEDRSMAAEQEAAVRHSFVISVAAAIPVAAILALAPLIWGPGFEDALRLGLIMLPGVVLLGIGRVMVAALTGRGEANRALLVGLLSFPLALAAYLLVIPDHGATGAAVVSACSYVAVFVLAALLYLRLPGVRVAESLPQAEDLREYRRLARKAYRRVRGRRF